MINAQSPTMITANMAFRINAYGDYGVANALGVISYLMAGAVATNVANDESSSQYGDVDDVLSEPEIEPQNEDALSRLVREAMQRAVESARGSEPSS